MGRRNDHPLKCTHVLSREAARMLVLLERHLTDISGAKVTKSEVVERAVRALAKKVGVEIVS
jgi:hypothetical protein